MVNARVRGLSAKIIHVQKTVLFLVSVYDKQAVNLMYFVINL